MDDFFTSIKIWERVEQDIALDKLSVKEYEDPFRDSGKWRVKSDEAWTRWKPASLGAGW